MSVIRTWLFTVGLVCIGNVGNFLKCTTIQAARMHHYRTQAAQQTAANGMQVLHLKSCSVYRVSDDGYCDNPLK